MTFSTNQSGASNKGAATTASQLPMNVGNIERTASVLAGAVGLLLLSRRLFVYVSLALASAYLVYRGLTGRCVFYTRANINTRELNDLSDLSSELSSAAAAAGGNARSAATSLADRFGVSEDDLADSEAHEIENWIERERAEDLVEQSSWESFPASDPPGGSIA